MSLTRRVIAAGLGPDQQVAVLEILSSGRSGDVLIEPAGAVKSRTVGALARTWEANIGGRVLWLAISTRPGILGLVHRQPRRASGPLRR